MTARTVGLDSISNFLGITKRRSEGGAVWCELSLREELHNPNGVAHGAVAFTLADDTMGSAVYSLLGEGEHCASVEIKINYLRSVTSGALRAEGRVIHRARRLAFTTCEITNGQGELVALATGTYALFGKRASGEETR